MIRFLPAVAAMLLAVAAPAQTLSSPPDVPTYQPQTVTYAAGTTLNVLGDGSNAKGGTAPAFVNIPQPSDPTPNVPAGYLTTPGADDYCPSGQNWTESNGITVVACNEKKFRTVANTSSFKFDDQQRYWGQPGVSHCHEFFGNVNVGAFSTRQTLRLRNASFAAGGVANATGYWEPCLLKTIGGKLYAIPSDFNTIYYAREAPIGQPIVDDLQPLHALLRFIMGTNMDDPLDATRKAEIAAANAQTGTAGRYSYMGNGVIGYKCILAGNTAAATESAVGGDGVHSPGFKTASGTDPWGGRCVAGSQIVSEFNAPNCWDGVNVASPSGYDHFRYFVYDSVAGKAVCPQHWFLVPAFEATSFHSTHGWSDYSGWKLSCDTSMSAKVGYTVVPGACLHADWMNGWNQGVINRWMSFCLGIGATPHRCQDSTIDATGKLISIAASPDGKRNPQVDFNSRRDTNDVTQLHMVDAARATMIHMH